MDPSKCSNYKIKKIESNSAKCDLSTKVVIIGDCQVGKTSIANRLIKNIFSPEYNPTSGYNFHPYIINVDDTNIKFQIWDMSGDKNYRSALFNLYKNAAFGILVYSITDKSSFENLGEWISELKKNGADYNKIILLGNKVDDEKNRDVSFEEGKNVCQKYDLELFMEISCADGFSSPNFIEIIAAKLYEDYILSNDKTDNTPFNTTESVKLSVASRRQGFGCCK